MAGPAPQSAYQTERYGQLFSYSFPNLISAGSYVVRLHFAEYRYGATGYNNKPARLFNVSINSKTVLSNFDVYATAGAKYKAITETFSTTADSNGKITIYFNGGTDNAEIKAIEILGEEAHIEINNVSKTNDDIVRLTSLTPARKFTTPCTIQALGTQSADLNVSLSCLNGVSRIGFDKSATAETETSTLNLSLPKDGTPVTFYIVGDVKSALLSDANIQVVDAISKQVYGAQPVTVFWFDNSSINTTTGNSYSFVGIRFIASPYPAISVSGQTSLMPAGLDKLAPQIQRLQLGIEQNFVSAIYQAIWRPDPNGIVWDQNTPSGYTIYPPSRYTYTKTVPYALDSVDNDISPPLYSRDAAALTNFSSSGSTQVTVRDDPFIDATDRGPTGSPYEQLDGNGNPITVDYHPSVNINATIKDWLVVYDAKAPIGEQTQWLSETNWQDNVSSMPPSGLLAMPSGGTSTPPKDAPIETGSTVNQILNIRGDSTTSTETSQFTKP